MQPALPDITERDKLEIDPNGGSREEHTYKRHVVTAQPRVIELGLVVENSMMLQELVDKLPDSMKTEWVSCKDLQGPIIVGRLRKLRASNARETT